MFHLTIPETELFDEKTYTFVEVPSQVLKLEHSLLSISKWESIWKKPFFESFEKASNEEIMSYIKCMTINKNVNPIVYSIISNRDINRIVEYMNDSMTATWFSEKESSNNKQSQAVTSELIYYWMLSFNIPVEFERWHINRLTTLIRVFIEKNAPKKKTSKRDMIRKRSELNAARLNKLNTSG